MIIPATEIVQVPKTDPAWVNFVIGVGVGALVPNGVGDGVTLQIQLADV